MADPKEIAQAMFDSLAGGSNIDAAIDTYLAEDFVEHEDIPGMDDTRETPRQMFKMMHAAFPDFRIEVQDLIQEGDKVAARIRMIGTHKGAFMGAPASGNRIEIEGIDILQFRGDKCVAHWGVTDMAGMMEQMGATGAS